jgi:hypothetical protein
MDGWQWPSVVSNMTRLYGSSSNNVGKGTLLAVVVMIATSLVLVLLVGRPHAQNIWMGT